MIKIAIIDDHDVVRRGIKYMLKFDKGVSLAGELAGGEGAGAFVKRNAPDVTLLDLKMPGVDGISALRDILAAVPEAKVLILTTSDAEEDVFAAIESGACGYVMKDSPPKEILSAIHAVAEGGEFFPEEVRAKYAQRSGTRGLSEREAQILLYVAKGFKNREIGELLGVSENSIKMHLKHVFAKLDVADRAEAVSTGIARGIIRV